MKAFREKKFLEIEHLKNENKHMVFRDNESKCAQRDMLKMKHT